MDIGNSIDQIAAKEIKDASETLPRAIIACLTVNGIFAILIIITLSFALSDVNNILATPTGYPFIQIFYNATQSYAATKVMTAIVIVALTSSVISTIAAASHQLWSFARDGGLPFSPFITTVSENLFYHTRVSTC
jgi:amino acid transporter